MKKFDQDEVSFWLLKKISEVGDGVNKYLKNPDAAKNLTTLRNGLDDYRVAIDKVNKITEFNNQIKKPNNLKQ